MRQGEIEGNATRRSVGPPNGCVRIGSMDQPGNEPLFADGPKPGLNLGLVLALGVAVMGLFTNIILVGLGLLVAAFNWFTTARQYQIYTNALVVVYGRPRVKAFPFSALSHVEMLELPMGQRLRVRLHNGGRFIISTQNIEEFRDRLEEALTRFYETYPGQQLPGEERDSSTPY